MNDYLAFAQRLALHAGDIMLKYFDTDVERQVKDDKTLVTTADNEINEIFIDEVEKHYPNHSIIGEEASKPKDSKFVWVCDPLDGTTQYSKSIPVAVSSFALVHQGAPIVGAVYDPFTRRLYTASKGKGAFLNSKPISVSNKNSTTTPLSMIHGGRPLSTKPVQRFIDFLWKQTPISCG